MIIRDLKISNMDICLSSVIYYMHKEGKDIYINKVLENYEKIYKRARKQPLLQKIKWFQENGFIEYYFKDSKYGHIPTYIRITDKFLMLHKLSMLIALLKQDEKKFNEIAGNTLKDMVRYMDSKEKQDGK